LQCAPKFFIAAPFFTLTISKASARAAVVPLCRRRFAAAEWGKLWQPCYRFPVSTLKSIVAAAIFALGGAAQAQETACQAPAKPMLYAEIYFGRNIRGHLGISEQAWKRFVARELTPRFPSGLTVIDGQGQWRGPSGTIVHEPTKIVVVVVPDAAPERERIAAAAAAYKHRFKQDSVAVVTRTACVTF
jgi:Protein of unknown function (DUF3574)